MYKTSSDSESDDLLLAGNEQKNWNVAIMISDRDPEYEEDINIKLLYSTVEEL